MVLDIRKGLICRKAAYLNTGCSQPHTSAADPTVEYDADAHRDVNKEPELFSNLEKEVAISILPF